MNQNVDNENGVSRLIGKVAAEKKKAGIALCLIAVMTVMWVKVLTKKGPETSEASPAVEATGDTDLDDAINITYVDLPRVPNRDDLISRDIFASAGWEDFKPKGSGKPLVDTEGGRLGPIEETDLGAIIAQNVKLGGIIGGPRYQAFINGSLMSVEEKLIVTEGSKRYECEVVEIRRDSVLIRCDDSEIVLKLVQTAEGEG